jgi:hypothetical protein
MKNDQWDPYAVVEVYSGTTWETDMIRSLLESAGIECFLKNNILNSYALEHFAAGGVRVMELNSDYRAAREIVEEYLKNMREGRDI